MVSITKWISKTRGISRSESAPYSTQKRVGNLCKQKNAYEREKKAVRQSYVVFCTTRDISQGLQIQYFQMHPGETKR